MNYQWIALGNWTYSRTFTVSSTFLQLDSVCRHEPHMHTHTRMYTCVAWLTGSHGWQIDLVCLGLDTVADVTINGQLVLSANNMFRTWTVDVKSALQAV